ncbi:peptidylprolyl isomerase [Alkalitalea saponilacus]|uniref:peptidylprolyl isomerase n=1 Tax=Alkalitalea saponilacus TaxID=889453 RepID=A0A1T5AIJ1_9BACT|nr:peptidylprolyl isomerase [Alkalitalea saponilacus]ASB48690.1 peptidylprolyl isomerase [Alkalitalea saponilacus]SKB34649.1 Peptidyl-prolyl cis-trans isomerase (rotamase)-cyclophilin family [Alkalitalea saponilacus]
MYRRIKTYLYLLLIIIASSCKSSGGESQPTAGTEKPVSRGSFSYNVGAMVDIHTFDHYTRNIQRGFGFYVGPHTIVTNLDLVQQGAYRVRFAPTGTQQFFNVDGYTAYSLEKNLVLLNVQRANNNYLEAVDPISPTDTLYTLLRPQSQLMVQRAAVNKTSANDTAEYFILRAGLDNGRPAFFDDHGLAGIIQTITDDDTKQQVVLRGSSINKMLADQHESRPVIDLSRKSNRVYPSHTTISGFRIVTDMGNIEIKLYDETPNYRDNFIRLVTDQYYDNLLIHRVLRGFLIQTGAADTREATLGEVVGWQGPGYTIPMNIVPGKFHKRGAIAASKLPHASNPRDESDGSQFYIVAGRRFGETELNELEMRYGITYTEEQRHIYGTIGGAPHLDNQYTVFGEVTSGMDVVDKISLVETRRGDRPEEDIWMKRIEIIYR